MLILYLEDFSIDGLLTQSTFFVLITNVLRLRVYVWFYKVLSISNNTLCFIDIHDTEMVNAYESHATHTNDDKLQFMSRF